MNKISTRLLALGVAVFVFVTACGEDTVLEPTFGEACNRGTLSAGEVVQGGLSTASCRTTYHFYTEEEMPYESWTVHLEAGKAYMFYEQQVPDPDQEGLNGLDAVLTLWGKDEQGRSIPLAVSDDEGEGVDGYDSEFWFIAPKSGDFQLVAGAYGWDDLGGYRLSMQSCPVMGTLDTAGVYTFQSPTSSCIRHGHQDYENYPITYAFLRVNADSFESIDVEVYHDVSTPYWEMGGPGFDTYSNIWDETDYDYTSGVSSSLGITTDEVGGVITVAIGLEDFNAGGEYQITFGRSPVSAPIPAAWRDGRLTLRSTFPKSEAKKLAKP